jgi:hypothetical protein
MPSKQDSNLSGLRYAKETSLRVLPGAPVWIPLEPNSYADFGAQYAQTARNPINPLRQRKKGAITDVDASGGFNQDLTVNNSFDLMQGFLFALAREKANSQPLNTPAVPFTSTTATTYVAAAGLTFSLTTQGNLVKASGFPDAANNGLKLLTAATATTLTTTGNVITAAPPATAKVETVGHQFGAGALAATVVNGMLVLSAAGIEALGGGWTIGEWIFIGGDTAAMQFATGNYGFARIRAIAAGALTFDKITGTNLVADTGATKTIQIFFGNVVRNENAANLIVRTSYNLERTLGIGNIGALTQAEYLEGSVPNEMAVNVPESDKVTVDFGFVSMGHATNNSSVGPKTGTRTTIADNPAFDTAASTPRIRVGKVDPTTANVTPLYQFANDLKLNVNNNVKVNKAIGVLGGFEATIGNFEAGASMTVFFQDVDSIAAIRGLTDVTLDFAVVESNTGFLFDFPQGTLGDGRNDVAQDDAVMAPLDFQGVQNANGYTLLINQFPYLPGIAG